jgi:hypothetical protein
MEIVLLQRGIDVLVVGRFLLEIRIPNPLISIPFYSGDRHARPHFCHLQITSRLHRVRRGVALVDIRERAALGTTAPRLTCDGQFHRWPVERHRRVVPLDVI